MVFDLVPCAECHQCNRKGHPSVMRGSAYCDSHKRHGVKVERVGFFQRFKDRLFEKNYDEKENRMKPVRGFRPTWWWK